MARVRDQINTDAQKPIRGMLSEVFAGTELEAAISMLAGVVACPTMMFGAVPEDDVIETAVDLMLRSVKGKRPR